ncbi:ImmA/IrrE family metallo-endopeptidase [Microcoleus sp. B7-D4]|uniref:ImmA/IrrE family metallo-endopeptidase n=1 Tax=Microcoleus sp. B7-D4 TaxID=2818696 RepID=UPI002FD534A7
MMIDRPRQHVRKKQIQQLVGDLHTQLKKNGEFQAPIPVEKLAREMNAQVVQVETEDDDLSGFLFRDPATGKSVIGVNKDHSKTRQRFTIAHEIGHLILHSFEDLHYDRKGSGGIFKRSAESATGENRDEVEANFFAAELLMPEELIYDKLEDIEISDIFQRNIDAAIRTIAKDFNVSTHALSIRMAQLGIVSIE